MDEEPAEEEAEDNGEEISFGNPHPLVAEVTMAPPELEQNGEDWTIIR